MLTMDASNHRIRWTKEENELLLELWDHSISNDENVEIFAELFNRTTEAIRQHHYELLWHVAPEGVDPKDLDLRTTRHKIREYRPKRPQGPVCPTCHLELPAVGVCDYCG